MCFAKCPYLCSILKQSFYLKNLILIENEKAPVEMTSAFFFFVYEKGCKLGLEDEVVFIVFVVLFVVFLHWLW